MPETTVYKYCHTSAWIAYVWTTIHLPLKTITSMPGVTKSLSKNQFRFGVLTFITFHRLDCVFIQWGTFDFHDSMIIL